MLRMDRRGMGKSTTPGTGHTPEQHAADIAALARHEGFTLARNSVWNKVWRGLQQKETAYDNPKLFVDTASCFSSGYVCPLCFSLTLPAVLSPLVSPSYQSLW
jgi:hypothetical protein